ncbi:hypothetical protein [Aquimarina aquimarini]|uniref:hypothetical protein n=1 Tax=Aquimarina aquimarini TaxID=1191734 RepID=UPI000D55FA6F|nr:hypothetical protein [Aquimarina aquimarini]
MSYTNNESLQELDRLLCEALDIASLYPSKGVYFGKAKEIAEGFYQHLDTARPQLAEALYKIDLAMQGYDDGASRARFEMLNLVNDPASLTEEELCQKYIQETSDGYKVYDPEAGVWFNFSEQAKISITIKYDHEQYYQPALYLDAYDPKNGMTISFIDPELTSEDLWEADRAKWGVNLDEWREIEYEDSWVNVTKTGAGIAGKTAGTLNAFVMGQHYTHSFLNLNGIEGTQWKSLDGAWHSYQEIQHAKNGFVRQGLKTSHHWAKVRGGKATPFPKALGKVCFAVNVGASIINTADAHLSDDANKWGVTTKNAVDIVMGITAFISGYGWAISGTYFLMDANDEFGDWGKPSGYSTQQASTWAREREQWAKEDFHTMDFELDYDPPAEQMRTDMIREIREFKRDKTYVQPKMIYQSKALRR